MASSYPAGFDSFATNRADATSMATTHAADHDNANDALNKIEAELGINPKGGFATVAARLAKPDVVVFARTGTLTVAAGAGRFTFPFAATLVSAQATVAVAPTGAAVICDVSKNGTTVFTTQANRPTIPAASTVSPAATPNVTAVAAGDYLTVDVDQVGSSAAGSDLVVTVTYTR